MYDLGSLLRKKAFSNGVWLYLLQFFNAVIPLLTLPYIVRILDTENYGIFSVALNIVIYMQVFVEYGFGMSATRKAALCQSENTKYDLNITFTAVVVIRTILMMVCCVLFAFYAFVYHVDSELCFSVAVLMFSLIGCCFQMNWLFQGLQDMKFISLVNIISRTISVILIFCFIHNKSDLLLYCFIYSITSVLSGLMSFVISVIKYHMRLVKITFTEIKKEFLEGFFVFTTQLSSKVFGAIGITFLGVFAPYSEVGIFSAIQKITNVLILTWNPITQVLYPISSEHMSKNFVTGKQFVYKMRRIILPVFVIMAICVALFSEFLISILFGPECARFYYWLFPLLLWVIIAINNNFLGIQILLGGGFDKDYSKCFQIGVMSSFLLNFILIYYYDGTGASIAPALSEAILCGMLLRHIRKIECYYEKYKG